MSMPSLAAISAFDTAAWLRSFKAAAEALKFVVTFKWLRWLEIVGIRLTYSVAECVADNSSQTPRLK